MTARRARCGKRSVDGLPTQGTRLVLDLSDCESAPPASAAGIGEPNGDGRAELAVGRPAITWPLACASRVHVMTLELPPEGPPPPGAKSAGGAPPSRPGSLLS